MALVALLATGAAAQFVAPEGSNFHNGSAVLGEDDGGASGLLVQLEEALVLGEVEEAQRMVEALRARRSVDLVRLGPRTHVPALEKALRLVIDHGDVELLERVTAGERLAIARARAVRDLDTLLDHAGRGQALGTWREAAWSAARLLFEEGRYGAAAGLARRLPASPSRDALLDAVAVHMPAPPPRPAAGPWNYRFSLRTRVDEQPDAPVPVVIDGLPGQVELIDTYGLIGMEPGEARSAHDDFDWSARVLGMSAFLLGRPNPRLLAPVRAGDRVVLPFNVMHEQARRWRAPAAPRMASLLALDLTGLGPEVAFRVSPDTRDPSAAFGPPTVAGDRIYSLLYRVGQQTEVSLCAFALADGELLFETPLVRGAVVQRFASRRAVVGLDAIDHRAREGAPAVRDGVVHACTGFGLVAAVDGVTGAVRHTFRYDRLFSLASDVYDPAYLFDTGGWEDEPVRLHGGRVVVAPSDSRYVYFLAETPGPQGQLVLEDPLERLDRRQIAGLLPDPDGGDAPAVLFTRRRDNRSGLALVGPDGHTRTLTPLLAETEPQTGRPAVVEQSLLLPTRAGLRVFDLADLERPPALLPRFDGLPPPVAAWPLTDGLFVLHPDLSPAEGEPAVLHGIYWSCVR